MKTFASTLGIIVFMAAVVVGSLAVVGVLSEVPVGSKSAKVGGASAKAAEASPSERTTTSVDKSVSAGKLDWTVHDARRVGTLRKFTIPSSTKFGDFVVVTFTVKNVSKTPVTLTSDALSLIDKKGLKGHPAASVNSEYVVPGKAILFNEKGLLEPGEVKGGEVNFDLAVPFGARPSGFRLQDTGTSGFRLELGDGDPTVKDERSVKLGF